MQGDYQDLPKKNNPNEKLSSSKVLVEVARIVQKPCKAFIILSWIWKFCALIVGQIKFLETNESVQVLHESEHTLREVDIVQRHVWDDLEGEEKLVHDHRSHVTDCRKNKAEDE